MGSWSNERKLGLGACVLVVIGAFLPWAQIQTVFGTISQSGIDGGDGWITAGTAALATIGFAKNRPGDLMGSIVLSLIASAVAIWDLSDIQSVLSDVDRDFANPSVGIGMWATAIGSLAMLVMSFVCWRQATSAVAATPEVPGSPLPPPNPPA